MVPKRVGDLLLESGVITEEQLQTALEAERKPGERLGEVLERLGFLSDLGLATVLHQQLHIPITSVIENPPDPEILRLIPEAMIRQHRILPLFVQDNRLVLGMVDPLDYYAMEDARLTTGQRIEPAIVLRSEWDTFVDRFFGLRQSLHDTISEVRRQVGQKRASVSSNDATPIGKLFAQLVERAVRSRASDIHFDPGVDEIKVRFRIDGVLHEEQRLPMNIYGMVVSRIKILSDLDITEHRMPQDGRIRTVVDDRPVDLRVAILPIMRGEKIVLRVLDPRSQLQGTNGLGFSETNLTLLRRALSSNGGIVLAVGPTGSGKTTTLYAVLQEVSTAEVNTVTIEDPVEFEMDSINQVAVNVNVGLTFASGLRSILRQDPDVVMVGEIRDEETAEIATRAALTGHLVLSTLHTLGALETIDRLREMGVPSYLMASAIRGVVAQRLVRRICDRCREPYALSQSELSWLSYVEVQERRAWADDGYDLAWPIDRHTDTLQQGQGCRECNQTGYRGRLAIHEVIYWDDAMRAGIVDNATESVLRKRARDAGSRSLLYDGLTKVSRGKTTLAEVIRTTGGYLG